MKRHINIKGAVNFRDLGDYSTKEGKTIKWRKIFRSGKLSGIEDTELGSLKDLQLKSICDFRTIAEQTAAPDKWHQIEQLNRFSLPIGKGRVDKLEWLKNLQSEEGRKNHLVVANKTYVFDEIPTYKAFFEILLNEQNYPLLYHCTAGKDRTGFATLLLLSALGVDKETILEDYLLTNQYLASFAKKNIGRLSKDLGLSKAQILPIFQAQERYLQTGIDLIEEGYGTIENYLEKELEVGPIQIKRLKEILLEG